MRVAAQDFNALPPLSICVQGCVEAMAESDARNQSSEMNAYLHDLGLEGLG